MTDAAKASAKLSDKQNTKVEKLADAIEDLAVALTANMTTKGTPSADVRAYADAARSNIRDALREFLMPALTIIEGSARQPYTNDVDNAAYVPLEDRVKCGECKRHFICSDTQCPHWHKAVRLSIAPPAMEAPGDNVA